MFLISRSNIVSLLHWIEYLRVDWRFDPSCMFSHSGAARARDKENPESVLSFTLSRVSKTWTRLLRDMKFDQEFDFQGNLANNYSCATRICCNMHLKCILWCRFKRLDQISCNWPQKWLCEICIQTYVPSVSIWRHIKLHNLRKSTVGFRI